MIVKEIIGNKDQRRREIEIAVNMIRFAIMDALSKHSPRKSRVNHDHFHGVDYTEIEIESLKRKWHANIKTVHHKNQFGTTQTVTFFELPAEVSGVQAIQKECEEYRKLIAS